MIQPHTGAGKGFYFIPEIGEEVLVGFEGGNAQCPYVMGAHYNGQARSDFYDSKNRIKGWKLRFGMLFKFIEKVGIWLSDPSGNEIHLDQEKKNINATTPETFTIRAKNIVFEATESITVKAGTDIEINADSNITQEAGNNFLINAEGNIVEHSDNRTELVDKDFSRFSDISNEVASEASLFSNEEDMTIQSGKQVRINSAENSNLF